MNKNYTYKKRRKNTNIITILTEVKCFAMWPLPHPSSTATENFLHSIKEQSKYSTEKLLQQN